MSDIDTEKREFPTGINLSEEVIDTFREKDSVKFCDAIRHIHSQTQIVQFAKDNPHYASLRRSDCGKPCHWLIELQTREEVLGFIPDSEDWPDMVLLDAIRLPLWELVGQPLGTDKPKELKEGVKHDDGKPDWTLLPLDQLEGVVKVLMFGAKKYKRDNWQKVEEGDYRYMAAAMRHLTSVWVDFESEDSESLELHIDHAICNLIFARYFITNK